MDNKHRTQI